MGSRPPSFSKRVAARVLAAITEADIPYTVVGERAGMSISTFERRIKGLGKPFDTAELEQVAIVLGMEPEAFLNPRRWREAS